MTGPHDSAIGELEISGATPEAVDRFLEEHEFPIREGPRTTFVFRGQADTVLLGHWLFGTAAAREMERLGESDLWFLTLELPTDSRVEYRFQRAIGSRTEWILDPLNPRTVRDSFGVWSVCQGSGYRRPRWTVEAPRIGRGELHRVPLPAGRGEARVYTPVGFRGTRPYPLLIVLDGSDYLRFASARVVLDNLIERRDIPPLIAAFVDPRKRILDFTNSPAYAAFLAEQLVPTLEQRFPLRTRADERGLLGAGLGAVAALTTAWRYPGFFGKLLLQSGSFTFTDVGPSTRTTLLDPVVDFVNAYRREPRRVASRVFLSCGVYDPLIYENRTLAPLLSKSGMDVRFVESPDGHNWENWRDRLRVGLSWLFPGPIWLYYR